VGISNVNGNGEVMRNLDNRIEFWPISGDDHAYRHWQAQISNWEFNTISYTSEIVDKRCTLKTIISEQNEDET
jgi:hypothetical protein